MAPPGSESCVETVTGVAYPETLTQFGRSAHQVFAGAGVRVKNLLITNVNVYALALYVEPGLQEKLALSPWRGQPVSALSNNSDFFRSVVNAQVQKAIQLVLVRDVTASQFWGALSDTLVPRLKAANGGLEGNRALGELREVFQSRPLNNGTTITLNWIPPSTLEVGVASSTSATPTLEATIDNEALVSSVFDIYLGDQPISKDAKAQFAAGLAQFL